MSPARRIRLELRQQERSYAWLAAQLGVSRVIVRRWSLGTDPIPEARRQQIAVALDIPLADLEAAP